MPKVYQILNWQRSFESERSRVVKRCSYVCMPNKIGLGLSRLLTREDGSALFGCFVLIAESCSRQMKPRNGYLTDDGTPGGRAWDAEDIAVMIRRPAQEVAATLEALCQPKIGWMVVVDVDEAIAAAASDDRTEGAEDAEVIEAVEAIEPTTLPKTSPKTRPTTPPKTSESLPTTRPRRSPDVPTPYPSEKERRDIKDVPPGAGDGAEGVPLEAGPGEDASSRTEPPTKHPAFATCVKDFGLGVSLGPKNRDRLNAMLGAFGETIVRSGLTEARANAATNPIPYADTVCNRLYAEQFQGKRRSGPARRPSPNAKVIHE